MNKTRKVNSIKKFQMLTFAEKEPYFLYALPYQTI